MIDSDGIVHRFSEISVRASMTTMQAEREREVAQRLGVERCRIVVFLPERRERRAAGRIHAGSVPGRDRGRAIHRTG